MRIYDTFVWFLYHKRMNFLQYQFDTIGISFAVGLGSLILFQIIYYIVVYGRTAFYKGNKKENKKLPSVSVVLCVKDEAYNLEKRLPTILEQEYPNFEVVVVNDASVDETEYVLHVLKEIYPNLNVVNLYNNVNKFLGKKYPLSLGIKSAKNDIILLTEADTIPSSYHWISEMVKGFTDNKQIVLGYTAYETRKGLLNKLIHYENQTLAMNYLGLGMIGSPYMGLGRNLAYTREMFFKQGGFISQYNIPVGDDDLFINKVANPRNTSVIITSDSINLSIPKEKMYEWIIQKKKHYTSLRHFKLKDKLITSLIPFTTFLLYALAIVSIVFKFPWEYVVVGILLKYIVQIFYYFRSSKTLGTKKIAIFAPIFEIMFMFFNTIINATTLFTKRKKWKY